MKSEDAGTVRFVTQVAPVPAWWKLSTGLWAALIQAHDDLPYHRSGHGITVAAVATKYITAAGGNVALTQAAALGHDIAYARSDPADREGAAAALTCDLVAAHEPTLRSHLSSIGDAILGTRHHAAPVTLEAQAVRAADLGTLALPWPAFERNNVALRAEWELLSGTSCSDSTWYANSATAVEALAGSFFAVPGDPGATVRWRERSLVNVERLRLLAGQ